MAKKKGSKGGLWSFRQGNRAEFFGVSLLQMVAAVAPVPRSEDEGVDVVGTLLRRDGDCMLAEDAFLVQIKSRTVKKIDFTGNSLKILMRHELPFFIASVDLTNASIQLFYVGVEISRIAVSGAEPKRLTIHLKDMPKKSQSLTLDEEKTDWDFYYPQSDISWTAGELTSCEKETECFEAIKYLATLDRENRFLRPLNKLKSKRTVSGIPADDPIRELYPSNVTLGDRISYSISSRFNAEKIGEYLKHGFESLAGTAGKKSPRKFIQCLKLLDEIGVSIPISESTRTEVLHDLATLELLNNQGADIVIFPLGLNAETLDCVFLRMNNEDDGVISLKTMLSADEFTKSSSGFKICDSWFLDQQYEVVNTTPDMILVKDQSKSGKLFPRIVNKEKESANGDQTTNKTD